MVTSPYEAIKEIDAKAMKTWINYYGPHMSYPLSHILDEWDSAKQELFDKVFDHELILTKKVEFEVPKDELEEKMDDELSRWNCPGIQPLQEFISGLWTKDRELYYKMSTFTSSEALCANVYEGDTFVIPAEWTVDGKPFKIQHGCKVMKTLGKVYNTLGFSEEQYEEVRLAHSMVLNQKVFKGDLCLSIHPFDYMTMSDNESNWTSCMRWREDDDGEVGEYRLGTVEMMNSPCVVVAYLRAHEDMYVNSLCEWNNKKWRMLMLVRPELILGNRQYPYNNAFLENTCLFWMKEICEANGFGKYSNRIYSMGNNCALRLDNTHSVSTQFISNYMYNDINSAKVALIDVDYFMGRTNYRLIFSGKATCMGCGATIQYPGGIETNSLGCPECMGYIKCCECGGWFEEDEMCWDEDTGNDYCQGCWDSMSEQCDSCFDWVLSSHITEYPIFGAFNSNASVCLCRYCENRPDYYEKKFGPIVFDEEVEDNGFNVEGITDNYFIRVNNLKKT